jgi:hypothetical protein
MAGVVWIPWYATLFRADAFAAEVTVVAPLALRYGATRYSVQVSQDDRYKIIQMAWFESKSDWYRYWDGPEMIEFRARNSGRFQIPIVYVWHEEIAVGEFGPEVPTTPEPEPAPQVSPNAAA